VTGTRTNVLQKLEDLTGVRSLLAPFLVLVSCLTYSSTVKMEVIFSSETLLDIQ
jgi:hypothetical protein